MAENLTIDRNKTAVLIMDYQNRQLGSFPDDFRVAVIRRANAVLDAARTAGIPVIFVRVQRGDRTPETELHPDILPKPGELLLTKRRTGPFSTTDLDAVLKKKGIDTLITMGISTSGCVLSTVRWAADIDYKLIVLSDCCADSDDEIQRVLMTKILPRQATVVDSSSLSGIL